MCWKTIPVPGITMGYLSGILAAMIGRRIILSSVPAINLQEIQEKISGSPHGINGQAFLPPAARGGAF
jgi:hypothetical protein